MLSRRARVTRVEIEKPGGRRVSFRFGSLRIVGGGDSRGAVVASKKRFKTSVIRHRARRRMYAALRECFKEFGKAGVVIAYPDPSALTVRFAELREALRAALAQQRS